jgi:hypothetical protein
MKTGFFERGITDFSGDVIDELVEGALDRDAGASHLLGYLHYSPMVKTTCFDWEKATNFGSELRKNPALAQPPPLSVPGSLKFVFS